MNDKRIDAECWIQARTHLTTLLGAEPDDLSWDSWHHLQGHAHVGGRELILIASRDDEHPALVFTPEGWNEVRFDHRVEVLQRCTIADHDSLLRVLAA